MSEEKVVKNKTVSKKTISFVPELWHLFNETSIEFGVTKAELLEKAYEVLLEKQKEVWECMCGTLIDGLGHAFDPDCDVCGKVRFKQAEKQTDKQPDNGEVSDEFGTEDSSTIDPETFHDDETEKEKIPCEYHIISTKDFTNPIVIKNYLRQGYTFDEEKQELRKKL